MLGSGPATGTPLVGKVPGVPARPCATASLRGLRQRPQLASDQLLRQLAALEQATAGAV